MQVLIGALVRIALFVFAVRLYRSAKKKTNAHVRRWRRRFAMLLFFAPVLLWIGEKVALHEVLQLPLKALVWLDKLLGQLPRWILAALEGHVPDLLRLSIDPLVHAAVYVAAGYLLGSLVEKGTGAKAGADEAGDGAGSGDSTPPEAV